MKRFLDWCLSTWMGSAVFALLFASIAVGGFYWHTQKKPVTKTVQELPMPEEMRALGALYPINMIGLQQQWHLLNPEAFGVYEWTAGDISRYKFTDTRRNRVDEREISFKVITEVNEDHKVVGQWELAPSGNYWLEADGFKGFRSGGEALYHLASPSELRITNSWLSFRYKDEYIPLHNSMLDNHALPDQATLTEVGKEEIEVAAGTFQTTHFKAALGPATLDIWANPNVLPLGIVKIVREGQTLELLSHGTDAETSVHPTMQPLLDGTSTFKDGCASCHKSAEECHIPVFPPT